MIGGRFPSHAPSTTKIIFKLRLTPTPLHFWGRYWVPQATLKGGLQIPLSMMRLLSMIQTPQYSSEQRMISRPGKIEVLAKDLDADVAPPAVVEDGKDENLTDACTDTGDQVPTSLPEILDMVGGLPEWQFQSGTSHGEGACLRRVASLLKPIKDFATQVRINEKVLSPAQAQGMKPSDGNNQWNWVVHELAQAQQNSMQSATRISRSSGWFAATQSLCEAVAWQC